MSDTPTYSTMELPDCETFYREQITTEMRRDGLDPETETPTYTWLNDRYPGFIKHLQRRFDLSPGAFYERIDVPPTSEDEQPFGFLDEPSQQAIDAYLTELRDRRGRATATIETRRAILRRYAEIYTTIHDTNALLAPLRNPTERAAEMDRVAAVFDTLRESDETLTTLASRRKYVQDTRQFYKHLVLFGDAEYNPLDDLELRFGWDNTPKWDNEALDAENVIALYKAATSPEDRFIVVGCCGWGLRPSEVAALHMRQLHLEPDDDDVPYIAFGDGERKNGPGTVSLLTGISLLDRRIESLSNPAWSGYLLPSVRSESGHRSAETVRRRFRALAESAGVTVDGKVPTPKTGRRFWYTTYGEAVRTVAARFESVAAEQGSDSAAVVLDNYLSESAARKHRRDAMRDQLDGLFEDI